MRATADLVSLLGMGPEGFYRLRVSTTHSINKVDRVIDTQVRIMLTGQPVVSPPFIRDYSRSGRYVLFDDIDKRSGGPICNPGKETFTGLAAHTADDPSLWEDSTPVVFPLREQTLVNLNREAGSSHNDAVLEHPFRRCLPHCEFPFNRCFSIHAKVVFTKSTTCELVAPGTNEKQRFPHRQIGS